MKQQITKKQWDEITKEQKRIWFDKFNIWYRNCEDEFRGNITKERIPFHFPSIGQIIEFLGDDLECMSKDEIDDDWYVEIRYHKNAKQTEWEKKELCDTLWEVCKYKLKIK